MMAAMSGGNIGPIPAHQRWRYRAAAGNVQLGKPMTPGALDAAAGEAPRPPETPDRRARLPEPLTRETRALTVLAVGLSVVSICLIVAAAYIATILP
jgi:hypothetical protein